MTSTRFPGTLRAGAVLGGGAALSPAEIRFTGGRITEILPVTGPVPEVVVAPGFVDLQVNGVDDVDCWSAGSDDWHRAGERLAETGVTAWLPTLVSRPLDRYRSVLDAVAAAAGDVGDRPAILGTHLEGPFLGGRRGAHPAAHVLDVDLEWLRNLPSSVRLVTLAPEQAGAVDAIELLTRRGVVVSLGHSAADHATTVTAVDHGARMVTHLFNGMGPLHHREPGIAGTGLSDDRVVAGLIADGVHVHPGLFRMIFRAKGAAGVVLVTDAVAWRAGRLAEVGVTVVDGAPRLGDGTLAGSILTMDGAVRNVVDAGVGLGDALVAASTAPARVLGETDRGRLEVGARADLVVLDADDLSVVRTVVGGTTVWEA